MINEQLAVSSEQCICTPKKHETVRSDYKQKNCSLLIAHCSLLFALCFFLFANSLFAQESRHEIQIQPRFIQRFSWTPDEYSLRYEVEIDKEEDGNYIRFLVERTEETTIHISLPYGNYRFRVIPYDLFNRPGIITEYQYIQITQAAPETNNFAQPAQEPRDDRAIFNFYLGASYFTHINIHGEKGWMSAPGQYLSGASLRLGFTANNLKYFNLGGEIIPSWYSADSLFYNNDIKSFLVEANLILQKDLFNRKAAFMIRAGAGFTLSFSQDPVASQNETAFYANTGFSFIWQPAEHFYMEAGVNYSYFFAINYPTGRIRPFAGFGTRIGR